MPGAAIHEPLVVRDGLATRYEAAHARLAARMLAAFHARAEGLSAGTIPSVPEPSRFAADRSYLTTVTRLCDGLSRVLASYETTDDPIRRRVHAHWAAEDSGSREP